MLSAAGIIEFSIGTIFINNIVLTRFLGLCPLLGTTNRVSVAAGMGIAVSFVMTFSAAITWIVQHYLFLPFDMIYLQTVVFVLVIGGLVQLVEAAVQKFSPVLYESMGLYLPLIATNCAVFAVALIGSGVHNGTMQPYSLLQSLCNGIMSGAGFTLALLIMAGIREKTTGAPVPGALEGLPIALLTAGLIALAFLGFSGMTFTAGAGG